MKKTALLTAAGLIMCCILSIATTRAMPNRDSVALNASNATAVFNQKKPHDVAMDFASPVLRDNVITYDNNDLHGTTLARNGRAIEEHPGADSRRRPVRREDRDGAVYVDDNNNGNDDDFDNNNNGNGGDDDDIVDNNNNGNGSGENDNYFVDEKDEIL
jgi:hypothetical protein